MVRPILKSELEQKKVKIIDDQSPFRVQMLRVQNSTCILVITFRLSDSIKRSLLALASFPFHVMILPSIG